MHNVLEEQRNRAKFKERRVQEMDSSVLYWLFLCWDALL